MEEFWKGGGHFGACFLCDMNYKVGNLQWKLNYKNYFWNLAIKWKILKFLRVESLNFLAKYDVIKYVILKGLQTKVQKFHFG